MASAPQLPDEYADVVDQTWLAARRITSAAVTALFPLIFLLDAWFSFPLSPVLPGIGLLMLMIIFLPMPVTELMLRRTREWTSIERERAARRSARRAKTALNTAALWFVLWIMLVA